MTFEEEKGAAFRKGMKTAHSLLGGEEHRRSPACSSVHFDCQPSRIPEKPCCARRRSSELKWLLLKLRGLGQLSES